MPGLVELLKPPNLDQQMSSLLDSIDDIRDSVKQLIEMAKGQGETTEVSPVEIFLQSDGTTQWQDTRELNLISAVVSSDIAARFALQIGTDQFRRFRLAASAPFRLIQDGARVRIPRGTVVTILALSGSPVWEFYGWAIPGSGGKGYTKRVQ